MNIEIIESMMNYLSESENLHNSAAKALAADSRGDEAAHEKIRANVFGIFRAILETAIKLKGEGSEALEFFATKLRDIPSSWRTALSTAREKGNSEAALVEKLKLQSVSEIEKAFAERKGGIR